MLSLYKETADTTLFVYIIAAIGALGGILFGFDTGVISGALLFIDKSFHLSVLSKEMIVSCVVLGALLGALFSGKLVDFLGRRSMLIIAAIAFIIGTLITVFAGTVDELIFGRFILGLAIGVTSYTTPLFISEMAPAAIRGSLVLMNAIMITGGEALAYLVDYIFASSSSWRFMFAAGLIPAVLLLIGMSLVPSTPRFMVLKGFHDRARTILQKIRRDKNVEFELNAIRKSCEIKESSWRALLSPRIRPVLIIGIGLGILQQFVGINTVMYYGPIIFQTAGFHSAQAEILATLGLGLVNTLMSIVGFLIVDRIGRRKLLLYGSAIAAASLMIVGLSYEMHTAATLSRWIALAALIFYIAGYCISVGSMFWLVISEIYPIHIRGLAMSLVTAIQWAANFIVAMTFLTILYSLGPVYTFWLYALMCILCFLFTYYQVPETTGVSLEQIQQNLEAGKPSRELGKSLTNTSNPCTDGMEGIAIFIKK